MVIARLTGGFTPIVLLPFCYKSGIGVFPSFLTSIISSLLLLWLFSKMETKIRQARDRAARRSYDEVMSPKRSRLISWF